MTYGDAHQRIHVGAIGAQPPMTKTVRAAAFRSRQIDVSMLAMDSCDIFLVARCDIFLVSFLGACELQW